MKRIRVTVDFPWAGIPSVEEYYDVPDDWDDWSPERRDEYLTEAAMEELWNTGVGCGATVVDEAGNEIVDPAAADDAEGR